jgi:hypothetical protein
MMHIIDDYGHLLQLYDLNQNDMSFSIRKANYYYATIKDQPGEAYKLLSQLMGLGVNLLAFAAVPFGPGTTQLTIFPDDDLDLTSLAGKAGLKLDGPHPAFLVQGDDELGALAEVHEKFLRTGVNVYASTGVSDGKGNYGYIIYVRPEDFERAAKTLQL